MKKTSMDSAAEGTVLIAGATGIATQDLAEIILKTPNSNVVGLSRTPPAEALGAMRHVAADMQDAEACRKAVAGLEVTHLVYAARATHRLYTAMTPYEKVGIEEVAPNLQMLKNIVGACEGPSLRHVHAVAGGKWYGIHLGPYPTPAREGDPGHMPPNYYFDQQNFLIDESSRKGWSWSTSRPGVICGDAITGGPNLMSTIAAYAAICRHLGRPFDFPGKPGNYTSLQELTQSRLLAEAIHWMCNSPTAANEAFNVTNGDFFRWEQVWPRLAEYFGLRQGAVRHFSLVQWMAGKESVWKEIVTEHGLHPTSLDQVASWGFADFVLGWDYDAVSSMTKIRRAGFHRVIDSEEMMFDQLNCLRQRRLCP